MWHGTPLGGRAVDGQGEGFDNPSVFCMNLDQLKKHWKLIFFAYEKVGEFLCVDTPSFPMLCSPPLLRVSIPPSPFFSVSQCSLAATAMTQ